MKSQAFNPYLPSYEYIPDGEPYVFDGRVYVYGSHDRFNGDAFCQNDYVCWSAPTGRLWDWRYEGEIFRKNQDPLNVDGQQLLFAPDVQKGKDGRYYLFYCLHQDRVVSVAVCDEPAGRYRFYGHVHYPDGSIYGRRDDDDVYNFDPAVFIDDDGRIFLYTGFSPWKEFAEEYGFDKGRWDGCYCIELEDDMLTVKGEAKRLIPGTQFAEGSDVEGHAFFEAASMRKFKDHYYLVYSSELSHELCYCISDRPDGGFKFGGTLISNADIGYEGNQEAKNYYGNTHGGLLALNGRYYVFYHRQSNGHQFSRQGCAEELKMDEDGHFAQAEMTSCGLNGKPLMAIGSYEARIACNLQSKDGACFSELGEDRAHQPHPYFTQSGGDREDHPDQYIANMRDGARAGFKYFRFNGDESSITLEYRGAADAARMLVRCEPEGADLAVIPLRPSKNWRSRSVSFLPPRGDHALYFIYQGEGSCDFKSFSLL